MCLVHPCALMLDSVTRVLLASHMKDVRRDVGSLILGGDEMKLVGVVKAVKSGIFSPEDSVEKIPWGLMRVLDADSGEVVKVKPREDELDEFMDFVSGLVKGQDVELTVVADRFGNIRLVLPDA